MAPTRQVRRFCAPISVRLKASDVKLLGWSESASGGPGRARHGVICRSERPALEGADGCR